MRHILVNRKAKADELEAQLKNGGDFAALAKKYSTDTGSAVEGRQARRSRRARRSPTFDKVAFTLKTNELSTPVQTQYGWHIIQALGAGEARDRRSRSRRSRSDPAEAAADEEDRRRSTKWVDGVKKDYEKKVELRRRATRRPTTTATAATTTTTSTTG